MSDYLPLCAFRQGLLPPSCRTCAWWQTTGHTDLPPQVAAEKRRQWMTGIESTWGHPGLLLESAAPGDAMAGCGAPVVVGSISYAPAAAVPRLRGLPFDSLAEGSALLFCLWLDEDQPRMQGKRLLQKALGQLKTRGITDAFAVAGSPDDLRRNHDHSWRPCPHQLFSEELLEANGFVPVAMNGGLVLMRADLRGLLSIIGQVETVLRRAIRQPTPSPAAWTTRGP